MAKNGQAYDNKSGQWLGSLVASSGADGTIMVNIQWREYYKIIFEYNVFIFRHVHLVIFIMFIWIVEILLEFVTLEELIPDSLNPTDLALAQVQFLVLANICSF